MTAEPREPEQRTLDDEADANEGLDVWMRSQPIAWLLKAMSERLAEPVRLVLLDAVASAAAVEFLHVVSERGESRVEVVAREPALLITVDAGGAVVVHVAADNPAEADAFVDVLKARPDIGDAVRVLVDRADEVRA